MFHARINTPNRHARVKSRLVLLLVSTLLFVAKATADRINIAAASDLKFAMEELVATFKQTHPDDHLEVVYGSSGKFHSQIQQGAPFDLYFSADIRFAESLYKLGFTAGPVQAYATGRLVLWSQTRDARQMTLASLSDPAIAHIAIANPKHAPYGLRAVETLKNYGIWDKVQNKLVYGENIAQTAQFVQTGNAQVGIIALALALSPQLTADGDHWLIPDDLHSPLTQGFVVTRRAADKPLAKRFARYIKGPQARATLRRYGFILPTAHLYEY